MFPVFEPHGLKQPCSSLPEVEAVEAVTAGIMVFVSDGDNTQQLEHSKIISLLLTRDYS